MNKQRRFGFLRTAAVVLLATMLLAACGGGGGTGGGGSDPEPATGGGGDSTPGSGTSEGPVTVTLAMTSAWDGLQPYNVVGLYSTVIFDQIYDRLTYLNGEGQYQPRLAERWEMGEDNQSVTFYLQPGAVWHDGEPVTADDVVFTVRLMTNPDTQATNRTPFRYLAGTDSAALAEDPAAVGVEAVDEHTVRFDLKEPMEEGAFLNAFARNFWVLPEHLLAGVEPAQLHTSEFWRSPVGSGPWVFAREVEGQFIELERNDDYFLGAPSFERLIVRVVPSTSLAAGLQTGEIDILAGFGMGDVSLEDWPTVEAMEHVDAFSIPTLTTQFMTINTQQDHLADERVRRALWMAINRQVLVDNLLQGHGVVARGPYGPSHPYAKADLPEVPYDPDGARALLEEAGWDFGREVVLVVPTGNVLRERVGALAQQDLNRIGVKVRVQLMDFTTALTQIRGGDYELALVGSAGSPDPDLTGLMHPDGANNLSGHRIPEIMTPIEEGLKAMTFEERRVHYDDLQVQLQRFATYAYLFHENTRMAVSKRLSNVPVEDFAWTNFGTWMWQVEN